MQARAIPEVHSLHLATLADYWALTKPEINFLIAIAALTGFYLGLPAEGSFPLVLLINTLAGTLLVASGAAALNQYVERRFDAEMRRTRRRPLASNRIEPAAALRFGMLSASIGGIYLVVFVNPLSSLLAILSLLIYLGLYTPLKRRSPLCTTVGAFSGAMPPLIGWAAATNRLSGEAWLLYGILFLWQFPHFMAIAWMYREDYARAGYAILPTGSRTGRFISWHVLLPLLVLVPAGAWAAMLTRSSLPTTLAVCVTACGFTLYGVRFAVRKSTPDARRLLLASIVYLPVTYLLLILGRG